MKIRIISAIVGIVVLVGVLMIPSPFALVVACSVLAAVAVFELLYNTGIMKQKSILLICMSFAALEIPLYFYHEQICAYAAAYSNTVQAIVAYLPLIWLGIFVLNLVLQSCIPATGVCWEKAQYAFLLTLYTTVGFGSIAMLRQLRNVGWWLVVLLLVIAWTSDTGAYFVGTFLGKHKMAPKISPKKSWEGFFGGWIISVLCSVALFIIRFELISGEGLFYTLYLFLPVVFVLAPLTVLGDLLASVIKRRRGIKDFGNIMPGHGGVMDRFDSVIFIAPLLYLIAANAERIVQMIAKMLSN